MDKVISRERQHYTEAVTGEQYSITPVAPKSMMFDLTNACNHACYFCNNPHQQRKISRMPKELGLRILREAREAGVEEVGFYNTGDPFVSTDLEVFVAEASRLGYSYIYLTTNGALARPERATKVMDAGLNSMKFSINAGSRETYKAVHGRDDWDTVISHLKVVSEHRKTLSHPFYLAISYVKTRLTEDECAAFEEKFGPLVDEIVFSECHDQLGQMSETESMLAANRLAKRNERYEGVCSSPFKRAHLTSEGYMTMCCVEYENYVALEDLREMSFMEAWHSPRFQDARRRHMEGNLAGTICDRCWFGNQRSFEPFNPELAIRADFDRTREQQIELARERLKAFAENSD